VPRIELDSFGFTPTESLVYGALLRLGPATGYAVSREIRVARANTYAALEGLVRKGAANRISGPPARYRPAAPDTLLALLAVKQGEALERLERSLAAASRTVDAVTHEVHGGRALANLVTQLVARAEHSVRGVVRADLWLPTLPAWRRASSRATLDIRIAGDSTDDEQLARGAVAPDTPTILVIDETRAVLADGGAGEPTGLWTAQPLIVRIATAALDVLAS
jgi:sugar-specific transcriptional regulator TrmB